ncbi:MAG: efflux RND transporter periplasmic adaptor subunit [Caldilineaceae bacterium]|nr:efflux RND transporter periplasmic adaptor subunit [Caldilineaceae bacterium]MCB0087661.1 efflux RND transporter periplasmic adaptor subunit [Caldilineaceae bacterium]MCB0094983.1 efflux RND transporter periplasmic adaptor subunit [Caldilineaceae bacterium]MCB0143407.1 efflux RND transporter periplasmic adaptor subunit [Caldilineaceae bacterium]MCB9148092.1 efflux RND transporter periplasmic adaptor subunit [Caldilineaceae bacterium]
MKFRLSHLLVSTVVSILLTSCAFLPSTRTEQTAAGEDATPTPIPTAIVPTKPTYTVKKGEIVDELEFSGRITAVDEEDLFFRTSGRVRNLFFKRDDLVKEGDVIADLEIDDLERELISVQLELERAQVVLDKAQTALEFSQREAQANVDIAEIQLAQLQRASPPNRDDIAIQQKRVELAQMEVERLSAGVDPLLVNDVRRAELQVQKLEASIKDAQITAPFDGQLMSISLVAGQAADAYKPVAVIADISSLEVSADLISSQLEGVAEGMRAEVTLVSRPGVILEGEIRRLPFPFGSGSSGTTVEDLDKSTRVTLAESAAEAGYEEGDLVRVKVELERKDDVLWLPPQALRNFDGRMFAVIKDGEAQRRVDVTVGIQTAEKVEIEEGLEEGQVVIGQ